jgi:hypothetical protein
VSLAASWLSTVLGPVARLATVAANIVLCRLALADGATLGTSARAILGTSSCPSLGTSLRLARLAALMAVCRGRRLPLLPITSVDLPLLPSEVELAANGDRV